MFYFCFWEKREKNPKKTYKKVGKHRATFNIKGNISVSVFLLLKSMASFFSHSQHARPQLTNPILMTKGLLPFLNGATVALPTKDFLSVSLL